MSVLSAEEVLAELTKREKIISYEDISENTSLAPFRSGIYGWYFKEAPPCVPTDGCVVRDGKTLLYIGQTTCLNDRMKNHRARTGDSSTLRRSLNTLFYKKKLLTKTDSDKKEQLNDWMKENAFVCWVKHEAPYDIEEYIITRSCLPLNIKHNERHPFSQKLKSMRNQN